MTLSFDIGKPIQLPETVNAVMNDGSLQQVPVTWDVTEAQLAEMVAGGEGKHEVTGTADGMQARAYINITKFNYVKNPSFEDGDLSHWTLTELGKSDELYVEDKRTDSLTGRYHMHFWSAAQSSVHFTLEQELAGLTPGAYAYNISIMGGDSGASDIFAYVKLNGQIVHKQTLAITTYGNWDTAKIPGITVSDGDSVSIGISVKCAGSGAGAWGKIDDAIFTSEGS